MWLYVGDYNNKLVGLLLFICCVYSFQQTSAIPQRGREPWSVILCKFVDTAKYEPQTRQWYQNWLTGPGPDTIEKYFTGVSNGIYSISGTEVLDWITLPWTVRQVRQMALMDRTLNEDNNFTAPFFDKAKELCVKFASRKFRLNKKKITILNAEHGALYDRKYGVLITPRLSFNSVLTHEMVHSFHIGHSYSDRNIHVFPFAHMGEYDDRYDLMSTANAHMYQTQYGLSGPGLNGPHLDYLGWLPSNRILYFGRDCKKESIIRLSSLSTPHEWSSNWLLVMIPFDKDNSANVFTLEFRTPINYDSGLKQEAVVIHKVSKKGASYYSTVVTHCNDYDEITAGTEWVHFLEQDSFRKYPTIKVRVEKIDKQRQLAVLNISSTFDPISCRRTETREHFINDPNGLDYIRVPSNGTYSNEQTVQNLQSKQQRFFNDLVTFGMNACRDGYIWRMIDPYDYVCVTEERKQLQNQSGHVRNPSDSCRESLVSRRAFFGDNVCVTPDESALTQRENIKSHRYMRYHIFFNGEETLLP